jgi:tetratricopeptide (TPR) repeat protein
MRRHLESTRAVDLIGKPSVDDGLLKSLRCLAGFYAVTGQLSEAYLLYTEALQSYDAMDGARHAAAPDYPSALCSYAVTCKALEKFGKAVEAYKKVMEFQKKEHAAVEGIHTSVSHTLYSIGNLYKTMGKYEDARKYYHESLEIEKRLFAIGTHSEAELVKALNNTGNLYYRMGSLKEAHELYLDSLERSRRLYVSDHDDVARTLYNCGNVQFLSKERERALLSFQEALRMVHNLHGQEYPEAGKILNNIGNVLMSLERFKRAADTFKAALKIKLLHAAGQYHSDVTMTMTNLASAYICLGETAEAMKMYEECLAYERASLPEDDPEINGTLDLMSQLQNLGTRRQSILEHFQNYVKERSSHRKTGLGVSKQDKLSAAAFVIAYVEGPFFKTLQHIKAAHGYDEHSKALTNGSLGELFEKCCRI